MAPNNQWDLWLSEDKGYLVQYVSTIIKNKKQLDELIKSYNQLPKKTPRTSLSSLSLPSFSPRSRALKKSFAKKADKKKEGLPKS
jgi:hypothetical protein